MRRRMSQEEMFKDVFFAKIDVDELPDLSKELGIKAMPTFVVFKNGEISDEKVLGAKPQEVRDLLVKHL
jgi:thioredoxin 1